MQESTEDEAGSDVNGLSKYEIRYKVLDLLSDIDQYVQMITLNCSEIMLRELPPMLLVEILIGWKKKIEERQSGMSVLLLK